MEDSHKHELAFGFSSRRIGKLKRISPAHSSVRDSTTELLNRLSRMPLTDKEKHDGSTEGVPMSSRLSNREYLMDRILTGLETG